MFEEQPQALQQKVKLLALESIRQDNPSQWFEVLYSEANGDSGQIPWARLTTHPYLQDWLERNTPQGSGRSALVVGCGLGDDAEALAQQGFQVTAFDISPTAIAWCQKRFPDSQVKYQVADLFALDPAWHQKFDFVFECRNIQALPLNVRSTVMNAIAFLLAPGGTLLVITRFRDTDTEPDGPPWPLSDTELAYFKELGLQEIGRDTVPESEDDPIQRLRIEYNREYTRHGS
ncbi:class I SAM-dependent methyltransferase [Moorena sp. SIO2C4]|uniref:class I SAM-dependent methyltransferase n=1 Tax=Moorena sp. SIO2C4 TaxID=2607824 RepID=UPI0013C6F557|nr:class I SAM-dependent methyltransferase [Moorena sp. SIO2C4]NES42852.1 methyltransferase domain-containing protein [Moorena sp. SIO2C4]